VDPHLAAAAAGSGPQAEQAMRLLTLQVLSQLGSGRGAARREEPTDFDDYAFRLLGGGAGGSGGAGHGEAGGELGGRGGSAQMWRIQQAIQRDPKAWTLHFNDHMRRQLGAEELQAGWSAAEYGRRRVDFSNRPDVEHAYHLMAEVHRLLHRGQTDHAEAFVCQALKTLEQVTLDRGDWQLAWAYSGLPDLKATSRVRRGAAHPVEVAAGMAYHKEIRAVEEWRASAPKKGNKGGGGPEGPAKGEG
jgi:hypothetical protein